MKITKIKKPAFGDLRERRLYAWLPKVLSEGDVIWMQHYFVREVFMNSRGLIFDWSDWIEKYSWTEDDLNTPRRPNAHGRELQFQGGAA